MTTSVTSILLFDTDTQSLVAEVLGADATATTFLLNCPSGTDSDDCGTYDESVTIGAWARATPPPDASTGVYDLRISMGTEWFYSQHCDMSMTVPVDCTTTNIGGNDDDGPTATYTSLSPTDDVLGWAYMPVTITAGLELLASATASSAGGATGATTGTSNSASTGTGTASVSGTQTVSATTSATGTNAAGRLSGDAMTGTLALAGLLVSWLLH
ncbi:hypothetical protein BX600DRAFT_39582 [Xylariales sp. PMI_506]|nr:hypothetical protein BX600DRAFT_39582 [Xylariales sp. PMI_506]